MILRNELLNKGRLPIEAKTVGVACCRQTIEQCIHKDQLIVAIDNHVMNITVAGDTARLRHEQVVMVINELTCRQCVFEPPNLIFAA